MFRKIIFGLILTLVPVTIFAAGWGAVLSGGLKGLTEQRLKDIELEEQYERQKQLILYRQQLEYRNQLRLQEELKRRAELDFKIQQEAQQQKEREQQREKERLALDERKRIENAEVEQITALMDKAESRQRLKTENKLFTSIPDWKKTVESEAFSNWFYQQPDQVQVLADSNTLDDAVKLINLFKNKK